MLTAQQRELISNEIAERLDTVQDYILDIEAELDCILVFKACLDADDALRLRLVASRDEGNRGEPCPGQLRLIHGSERLSK